MVGGGAQFRIVACLLHMLCLCSDRGNVALVGVGGFLRGGARFDAAGATVVADTVHGDIVNDRRVVGIVDDGGVDVIHIGVIGEVAAIPAAALIADAAVAEAVVDSAVEADVLAPISLMEEEGVAAPA